MTTAQLRLPAALVSGGTTPCPCAASAPRGSTEALPPGDARTCGQPAAPAQAFPMSVGPCSACGGVGERVRGAAAIWERFGDVANYVEPFAGSLAVLLARPHAPRIETVNDADCYLANFWRCLSALRGEVELSPEQHSAIAEEVARWADWPVNEADLHARHRWLVHGREDSAAPTGPRFRERMRRDPEYFDARIAGWWVWGLCAWIGSGWCTTDDDRFEANTGTHPVLRGGRGGHHGNGVHAKAMREPRLSEKLPSIGATLHGVGIHSKGVRTALYETFARLAERLRYVRVACGDWSRVVTDSVTWRHGTTAILLDPPYSDEVRAAGLYAVDSGDIAAEVLRWCVEHGADTRLRVALCGYDNEAHGNALEALGWSVHAWKAKGGYGGQRRDGGNDNAARERIWFSPGCLAPVREPQRQGDLFAPRPA